MTRMISDGNPVPSPSPPSPESLSVNATVLPSVGRAAEDVAQVLNSAIASILNCLQAAKPNAENSEAKTPGSRLVER